MKGSRMHCLHRYQFSITSYLQNVFIVFGITECTSGTTSIGSSTGISGNAWRMSFQSSSLVMWCPLWSQVSRFFPGAASNSFAANTWRFGQRFTTVYMGQGWKWWRWPHLTGLWRCSTCSNEHGELAYLVLTWASPKWIDQFLACLGGPKSLALTLPPKWSNTWKMPQVLPSTASISSNKLCLKRPDI